MLAGVGREGKKKEAGGLDPTLRLARSPGKCRALQWHGFLKYCKKDTALDRDYGCINLMSSWCSSDIVVIHLIALISFTANRKLRPFVFLLKRTK